MSNMTARPAPTHLLLPFAHFREQKVCGPRPGTRTKSCPQVRQARNSPLCLPPRLVRTKTSPSPTFRDRVALQPWHDGTKLLRSLLRQSEST